MATVRDVISAALRKIGIVASGEEADADAAAEALFAFNAMFHGFKAHGVDLTYSDKTLSDDFPIGAHHIEGAVYLLASRLSPDYLVPAQFDADGWWRMLQAEYATVPTLTIPAAILRVPSRYEREGTVATVT